MFNDITKPAPPLPTPQLRDLRPGISLLLPLSRRGHGPGIVILIPETSDLLAINDGVPSHLVKWAEEGYTVLGLQERALITEASALLKASIEALSRCDECEPKGNIGLVSYVPSSWNYVASALATVPEIVAAVTYANALDEEGLAQPTIPVLQHLAGSISVGSQTIKASKKYYYPKVESFNFATPFHSAFNYGTEALSHTRNLTFLKPLMGGPFFDLEAIWEEHTYYEFADRSVEHTMSTMVQEPYVNHVPTMTGGIGRGPLTNFYRNNFIFNNSADTEIELLSRTIGIDRVIDEFLFKFTHDQELDWLLPGVPPTYGKAEIPFTAVVNIRGDRLYHEHISWDQGTVLVQLGLMPEYLPFPRPTVKGTTSNAPNQLEYRVPVAGIESALKMRDRNSLPSNEMFKFKTRDVCQSGKLS